MEAEQPVARVQDQRKQANRLEIVSEKRTQAISIKNVIQLYKQSLDRIASEFSLILDASYPSHVREKEKTKFSSSFSVKDFIELASFTDNSDVLANDSSLDVLSKEAAYFLLNQVFTYILLQTQYEQIHGITIPALTASNPQRDMQKILQDRFSELLEVFEFGPVFNQNPFLSDVSFSKALNLALYEFIERMGTLLYEIEDHNILGTIFQELIPISEQKRLGQIYTPLEVADLMVQLAIRNPEDMVLDPACGCGSLLLKSYDWLKNLNTSRESHVLHPKLISQLWGVEINPFPAHLSMLALAFKDIGSVTHNVGILLEDFLKLGPLDKYIVKTKDLVSGEIITREMPPLFDTIIANPPYIKQEKIPNKKQMMKQLPQFAANRIQSSSSVTQNSSRKSYPKLKLDLTGKTDYYGFFLWYSTFFLKEGGRLCFIIPNKWMDVKYGEKLKKFLLSHFQVRMIIGFGKNTFAHAQVSTVILIADKASIQEKRHSTVTQFVLLNSSPEVIQIKEWLKNPTLNCDISQLDRSYVFDSTLDENSRTIITQRLLLPEEKWSIKYLYQSQFARKLEHQSLVNLDNGLFSRVVGGIKTGANDFYFPSSEDIQNYPISPDYLKPGIRSGRNIPSTFVISKSINSFLNIPSDFSHHSPKAKGLAIYIQDGEEIHQYPKRPSVIWKPWYRIPEESQDCPDILFLRHIDRHFRAHWNQVHAIVADGVRGITVLQEKWLLFLLGLCNSTFFYWQAHVLGRWEGQGDLQLLVYELRRFQIPDVSKLTSSQILRVERAMQAILDRVEDIRAVPEDLQETLDRAILACMNLETDYALLKTETSELEARRLGKALS